MRIAGYIEHPNLKITIFQMENKYTLKFENQFLEQSYKIRQSEQINSVADIRNFVDARFLEKVEQLLGSQMSILQEQILASDEDDDFDEII